jgi:rhodanese-related sulfurtransferase
MRRLAKAFVMLIIISTQSAAVIAQGLVINVEQVREWMTVDAKALLIDVRTTEEYREGHIPGAISIPAENFAAGRGKLPKEKSAPLIFYCRGAG